jgi:secondary thiamine-phosphate synthase enzyme
MRDCIAKSGMRNGLSTAFVVGSTAAITTMEYEPGLLEDLPRVLERIIPSDDVYRHELTWHDDNGHSHVKAALLGPSVTVPVADGVMTLGTWQQIVLIELDTRPRDRQVVVQVLGE